MNLTLSGELIAFLVLAVFIFAGAIFMLSLQRIVHMVFAMAFTFLSIAGIYILLQAEFIAVVQIIVYTGAVSILAVFGIMMTKHTVNEEANKPRRGFKAFVLFVVVAFISLIAWVLNGTNWGEAGYHYDVKHNTAEIGTALFTKFVIPFELVSVLLLVALIGAILLAKEDKEG